MNIFEALEAGNGKATLYDVGITDQYVQRKAGDQFYWITQIPLTDFLVDGKDLMRNDWRAYVPRETPEVECGSLQNKTLKAYYALCLQAAEAGYSEEMIGKIITRPGKFDIQGGKTKRREVFKEIELSKLQDPWAISNRQSQGIIYYPLFLDMESDEKFKSLYGKSHMTMILEWEE